MTSKTVILSAFIIVALIQLYVPIKIIWDKEDVLNTGKDYKFKTAPIDPNDPFRGKYITLSFQENTFEIKNNEQWVIGETIYVYLFINNDGFTKIKSVSKDKISDNNNFLKAKVNYVSRKKPKTLRIKYPFDRFYMEESKAPKAELMYNELHKDTTKTTYALVSIKNGDAVLKDVLIDGISINEIVKAEQEKKK